MTPILYAKFVQWQDLELIISPNFEEQRLLWWIHQSVLWWIYIFVTVIARVVSFRDPTVSIHVCWVWEYYIRRNEEDPGGVLNLEEKNPRWKMGEFNVQFVELEPVAASSIVLKICQRLFFCGRFLECLHWCVCCDVMSLPVLHVTETFTNRGR